MTHGTETRSVSHLHVSATTFWYVCLATLELILSDTRFWCQLEHRCYYKPEGGMHIETMTYIFHWAHLQLLSKRQPCHLYQHYCLPCLCLFLEPGIFYPGVYRMKELVREIWLWFMAMLVSGLRIMGLRGTNGSIKPWGIIVIQTCLSVWLKLNPLSWAG